MLPVEHNDPTNAKILAISEDKIEGFVREPFEEIARRSSVPAETVMARIAAMLRAETVRRVRQTLLATNLADGALVAWKVPPEKISFVKSLQNEDTEILEVHDCKFEGKSFTHYILQHHGKLISVLKTASENVTETNTNIENPIICEREKGLQMASFKTGEDLIFVISDMSEAENLNLARTLSDNLKSEV